MNERGGHGNEASIGVELMLIYLAGSMVGIVVAFIAGLSGVYFVALLVAIALFFGIVDWSAAWAAVEAASTGQARKVAGARVVTALYPVALLGVLMAWRAGSLVAVGAITVVIFGTTGWLLGHSRRPWQKELAAFVRSDAIVLGATAVMVALYMLLQAVRLFGP